MKTIRILIGAAILLYGLSIPAYGNTWKKGNTSQWTSDGNWTTTLNWVENSQPAPGSSLVFNRNGTYNTPYPSNNNLTAGTSFSWISFGEGSGGTYITINGNQITLTGGLSSSLFISYATFNPAIIIDSPISLAATTSGLYVNGAISGTGGITSTGPIILGGINTYTGATTVSSGNLRLSGSGTLSNTSDVTIGGELIIDSYTTNHSNRVNDAAGITLNAGGKLSLYGYGGGDTAETLGALTLADGISTVNVTNGPSRRSDLTLASLTRNNMTMVNFTGTNLGVTGGNPHVFFTATPPQIEEIMPYALVNGTDFAAYDPVEGIVKVVVDKTTIADAVPTDNVKVASLQNVADANKVINSLTVNGSYNITGDAGTKLTLGSGGLLTTGATTISVPELDLGTGEAFIINQGATTVNSVMNVGTSLIKSGTGNLTIGATNNYTGDTRVYQGTLTLTSSNSINDLSTVSLQAGTLLNVGAGGETIGALSGVNSKLIVNGQLVMGGNGANTSFSGNISGAGGITKEGTGSMTLSYAATTSNYTGPTNIQGGTLVMKDPAIVSSQSAVTVGSGAVLDFQNYSGSWYTVGSLAGAGEVKNRNTNPFWDIRMGGNNSSTTFSGVLSGGAGATFTKVGTGTMVLDGQNTLAGTLSVSAGTLSLGGNAGFNSAANLNVSGGVLDIGGYSGTVGTVTLASGSLTGSGGVLTPSSATLQSGTLSARFGGSGGVTKSSTGTLTVSNTNVFSDGAVLTVSDGILNMGSYSETVGGLTMTGGSISGSGAEITSMTAYSIQNGQIDAALKGNVGLNKTTTGTAKLFATNTYTGTTAITGGTLKAFTRSIPGNVTVDNAFLTFDQDTNESFSNNISGNGNVLKRGAGTLTLTGTNSYTGLTEVEGGTLVVGSPQAVSSGANLKVASGTLDIGTNSITIGSLDLGEYGSTWRDGQYVNVGEANGYITGTGTITGSSFTVRYGSINANLAGAASLTKTSTGGYFYYGAVTLSGHNTYTGGTNIEAGGLVLGNNDVFENNSPISVGGGGNLSIDAYSDTVGAVTLTSGGIYGTTGVLSASSFDVQNGTITANLSGSASLTKSTTATVTLSGVNTYAGVTAIQAGTLIAPVESLPGNVTNDATLVINQTTANATHNGNISGSGSVTKIGAGQTVFSGANTYIGATQINEGVLKLGSAGALPANSAVTVYGGVLDIGAFSPNLNTTVTLNNNGTINGTGVLSAGGYNMKSGTVNAVLGGAGGLTKNTADAGPNIVTLTAANNYTGPTSVLGGTLRGTTTSLHGGITVGGGAFLDFAQNSNGSYGGVVTGAGSLLKDGTGTVTLTAANDYTGSTIVNEGTLKYGRADAIAAASAITVSGGAFDTGTYTVNTGNLLLTGGSLEGSGSLTATAYDLQNGTVNVSLGGAAAVNKNGAGTVVMNAMNTYSGGTVISAGTLLGNTNNFNIDMAVSAGAYFGFQQDFAGTYDHALNGVGGFVKEGSGTVTITGTNTYTGGMGISGGTLAVGAVSAMPSVDVNISNGAALDVGALAVTADTVTLTDGKILGSGSIDGKNYNLYKGTVNAELAGIGAVTKSGTGTVILNSANSYSGGTSVSDGTLTIAAAGGLPDNAPVSVSWGVLDIGANSPNVTDLTISGGEIKGSGLITGNTYTVQGGTVGARLGGTAGVTMTGWGVATLSGANTYTGATAVQSGTLRLSTDALAQRDVTIADWSTLAITNDSGTHAYNGSLVSTYGSLIKEGAGTVVLNTPNTYQWFTSINGGTLALGVADALLSTTPLTVAGGTLDIGNFSPTVGDITMQGGSLSGSGVLTGNSYSLQSGAVNVVLANNAPINISGSAGQRVDINTDQTYTQDTNVNSGILAINGSLDASNAINVASGATVQINRDMTSKPVTLAAGATIGGTGTYGALDVTGITVAPGASTGTFTTGNETWGNGGAYALEVSNATGVKGTASGWDLLQINGTLDITAGANSFSMNVATVPAGIENFNKKRDYTWVIASATGGINGFDENAFSFDDENFKASHFGSFYATRVNDKILVNYSGIKQDRYEVLHNFKNWETDDVTEPYGGVAVSADGQYIYGASSSGAAYSGAVYRMKTDGTGFTLLYSFPDDYVKGGDPIDVTLSPDGTKLYGINQYGGSTNNGTVFRIGTDGSGISAIHHFGEVAGDTGRAWDNGITVSSDGNTLYGFNRNGSYVFRLQLDGSGNESGYSLYSMTGNNGLYPYGKPLLSPDGQYLYGTAAGEGPGGDYAGTLFRINTDMTGFTVLVDFPNNSSRSGPYGNVILGPDNMLYGVTNWGGVSGYDGAIYKVNTNGSGLEVLQPLDYYVEGQSEGIPLSFVGGKLYGMISWHQPNGHGRIFSINPDGTGFTFLHEFVGGTVDGGWPEYVQMTASPDGKFLYGLTPYEGKYDGGTLFVQPADDGIGGIQGPPPHLTERPVVTSIDQATGDIAYEDAGNVYYNGVLIGPGAHPSLSNGKVVYRDDASGTYKVWDTVSQGAPVPIAGINAPADYAGGVSSDGGKMVLEGDNGIYYSADGSEFSKILSGNVYRHPVIAGNKIIYEKFGEGTDSDLYLYNLDQLTLEYLTNVNVGFPTKSDGAAPWLAYDGIGTYYAAWQGWDGTDWEIYYWDSTRALGDFLQITDNDYNAGLGKYTDDMLPQVGSDGTVVYMSYDDWDIYQWTETGGIQPVATGPGDQMYPVIGQGGEVTWGNYDAGGNQTGFSSGFAQSGAGPLVWGGGGADMNFSTPGNWSGGSVPASGDDVTFGTGGSMAIVDAPKAVGLVTFNGSGAFVVGGPSALTIYEGIVKEGASDYTLSCPIVLGADQSWNSNNAAGVLSVSGAVDNNGKALTVDGVGTTHISGVISGAGSLTKEGDGKLALLAGNTYSGATNVNRGTVELSGDGALANTTSVTVGANGALRLINTGDNAPVDRINAAAGITMNGGLMELLGSDSIDTEEVVGTITLGTGNSKIKVESGSGHSAVLRALSLVRNGSATVDFIGANLGYSDVTGPRIMFDTPIDVSLTNGIIPYATWNGTDFATYSLTYGVKKFENYMVVDESTDWGTLPADSVVDVSVNGGAIDVNVTVYAMKVGDGVTIEGSGGANKLTVEAGGIVAGGGVSTINISQLDFGTTEGNITSNTGAVVTINSEIQGNAGLKKSGEGVLNVYGVNTYTGTTTIDEGTLSLYGTIAEDATVEEGATLMGSGNVGGLIINSGGTVSPGNSPGAITVTDPQYQNIFRGGGTYVWEINDALGDKGPAAGNSGWDWMDIAGELSVMATGADKFIIDITSVLLYPNDDTGGDIVNFNPLSGYDWIIATAQGGITYNGGSFNENLFDLLTGNFSNGFGAGGFSISQGTDGIYDALILHFNPAQPGGGQVPEPSTLLLLLPLLGFGLRRLSQRGSDLQMSDRLTKS